MSGDVASPASEGQDGAVRTGAVLDHRAAPGEELLQVRGLTKYFPVTRGVLGRVVGQVRAVENVSFSIAAGETLGLVGESGSGKTTVGRSILRLIEPTAGEVRFDGSDVLRASPAALAKLRRSLQVIFQDPYSSLNPRLRVVDILGEPLEVHGIARGADVERQVAELLERVGLPRSWLNRYPHEFSGGQRQRIGIARAIALGPKLVVCDEPVSALDVSIQAQIVNLLKALRREMGLAYLFIAHDLSVVRHLSHRVAVMYLGELVELSPARRLFEAPAHPYTRALLSAIPVPDPRRRARRLILTGDIPSPLSPPSGCRFHTRCPAVTERCRSEEPKTVTVEPQHTVKCVHAYDAAGPDWFRLVEERIERQTAENERNKPPAAALPLPAALPDVPPVGGVDSVREPKGSRGPLRSALREAVRPLVATKLRRVTTALLGVTLVLLAIPRLRAASLRHAAERELALLEVQLRERSNLTGSPPASLAELSWRLPPIFGARGPRDAWGHPLKYRAPALGLSGELRSLGPDGVPSGDDLVLELRD